MKKFKCRQAVAWHNDTEYGIVAWVSPHHIVIGWQGAGFITYDRDVAELFIKLK